VLFSVEEIESDN